jgi:hypothetical protein
LGQAAIFAFNQFPEGQHMIRPWLAAAVALAMTTGVAVAQTSSSSTTSTQSTTAAPAVVYGGSSSTSTHQTTSSDGVMTDRTQTKSNDTNVSPAGDLMTTKKSSETTTTH